MTIYLIVNNKRTVPVVLFCTNALKGNRKMFEKIGRILKNNNANNESVHNNHDNDFCAVIPRRDFRKKYYHTINRIVKEIFYLLDQLKESGRSEYLSYVASVETELKEDYADVFPYDEYSESIILDYVDALENLKREAQDTVSMYRKELDYERDREIGQHLSDAVGTDRLANLDDVLREHREKDANETRQKVNAFAAGVAALKGDCSSLASVFGKMANAKEEITLDESSKTNGDDCDD